MSNCIDANCFPSFFISHGGPTFMYNDPTSDEGAWYTLNGLGKKFQNQWKPDYYIVVSAHWQSSTPGAIEIAVPHTLRQGKPKGENSLVYDFYNFPLYMYKEQFRTEASSTVAEKIRYELEQEGYWGKFTERGIDHGVWVPFKVLFLKERKKGGVVETNSDWALPGSTLIQVSLPANVNNFDDLHRLGRALSRLRTTSVADLDKGPLKGLIICSGMTGHNLRDFFTSATFQVGSDLLYVEKFHEKLREAINSLDVVGGLKNLQTEHGTLLKKAHPTLEHFAPLVVATGLIDLQKEPIKEIYNSDKMPGLGWGIYRFGHDYVK